MFNVGAVKEKIRASRRRGSVDGVCVYCDICTTQGMKRENLDWHRLAKANLLCSQSFSLNFAIPTDPILRN